MFETKLLILFILLSLFFSFFLLYPLYLRDNKPAFYKGTWRVIGSIFRNRYGVFWVLILYFGINIFFVAGFFTQEYFIRFLAMLLYFSIFMPVFLWYPYHLKEKRPEKYKGIWRLIGDWLGDPKNAFPSWRDNESKK